MARAQVFLLPAALDPAEHHLAEERYPGLDLSAGLGMAVASDGVDPRPPPATSAAGHAPVERPPAARRRPAARVMIPALGALGCLVALAIVWATSGLDPATIQEQLGDIRRDGDPSGRSATVFDPSDLHGTGTPTRLVLFRDDDVPRTLSDELHIYDEEGGDLERRWRFEPSADDSPAEFQFRGTADVDGDGADEILGGFGYTGRDEGRRALVPFAIDWDHESERYRLVPLDFGPPALRTEPRGLAARQYLDLYSAERTFRDPDEGVELTGHRVQDFTLTPGPPRLVAGWFVRPWLDGEPARFELQVAILDMTTGRPDLTPCRFPGRPLTAESGLDRSLPNVFREAYAKAAGQGFCTPLPGTAGG